MDWPITAPIFTIVFGMIIVLLNRCLGSERDTSISWKIVLFIAASALFQLAVLGTDYWGVSSSGLLRLDGLTTSYSVMFLFFFVLNHVNLRFSQVEFEKELPLFELAYLLFGLLLLLSNNLIIHLISLPILYVLMAIAPQLTKQAKHKIGYDTAVVGGLVILVLAALSIAAISADTKTLQLDRINETIQPIWGASFYIGWWLQVLIFGLFILIPPMSLFLRSYEKSGSWALAGLFRGGLPILAVLLMNKWFVLTSTKWEDGRLTQQLWIQTDMVMGVMCAVFLFIALIVLLNRNSLLLFFQTVWSIALYLGFAGQLLGGQSEFVFSHQGIVLSSVLIAAMHYLAEEIGVSTNANLEDMREKLRQRPMRLQFSMLVALMSAVPLFSFGRIEGLAIQFHEALSGSERAVFSAIILIGTISCSAVLLFRIVEIYLANARRNTSWDHKGIPDRLWGYTLVLILIVLGVFPTPLYKYLIHSIRLFIHSS